MEEVPRRTVGTEIGTGRIVETRAAAEAKLTTLEGEEHGGGATRSQGATGITTATEARIVVGHTGAGVARIAVEK